MSRKTSPLFGINASILSTLGCSFIIGGIAYQTFLTVAQDTSTPPPSGTTTSTAPTSSTYTAPASSTYTPPSGTQPMSCTDGCNMMPDLSARATCVNGCSGTTYTAPTGSTYPSMPSPYPSMPPCVPGVVSTSPCTPSGTTGGMYPTGTGTPAEACLQGCQSAEATKATSPTCQGSTPPPWCTTSLATCTAQCTSGVSTNYYPPYPSGTMPGGTTSVPPSQSPMRACVGGEMPTATNPCFYDAIRGTSPLPGSGTSGSMRNCQYPTAKIFENGQEIGMLVWCEGDYVNCRKGSASGPAIPKENLRALGAPDACESAWSGGAGGYQSGMTGGGSSMCDYYPTGLTPLPCMFSSPACKMVSETPQSVNCGDFKCTSAWHAAQDKPSCWSPGDYPGKSSGYQGGGQTGGKCYRTECGPTSTSVCEQVEVACSGTSGSQGGYTGGPQPWEQPGYHGAGEGGMSFGAITNWDAPEAYQTFLSIARPRYPEKSEADLKAMFERMRQEARMSRNNYQGFPGQGYGNQGMFPGQGYGVQGGFPGMFGGYGMGPGGPGGFGHFNNNQAGQEEFMKMQQKMQGEQQQRMAEEFGRNGFRACHELQGPLMHGGMPREMLNVIRPKIEAAVNACLADAKAALEAIKGGNFDAMNTFFQAMGDRHQAMGESMHSIASCQGVGFMIRGWKQGATEEASKEIARTEKKNPSLAAKMKEAQTFTLAAIKEAESLLSAQQCDEAEAVMRKVEMAMETKFREFGDAFDDNEGRARDFVDQYGFDDVDSEKIAGRFDRKSLQFMSELTTYADTDDLAVLLQDERGSNFVKYFAGESDEEGQDGLQAVIASMAKQIQALQTKLEAVITQLTKVQSQYARMLTGVTPAPGMAAELQDALNLVSETTDPKELQAAVSAVLAQNGEKLFEAGLAPALDVDPNKWYAGYVGKAKDYELMSGQAGGDYFDPSGKFNFAQLVKTLANGTVDIDEDAEPTGFGSWPDWVQSSIAALQDEGNDLSFLKGHKPDDVVDRAAFAHGVAVTIMKDQLPNADLSAASQFKDLKGVNADEKLAIALLTAEGVVAGVGGEGSTKFAPDQEITRAEAAKLLSRSAEAAGLVGEESEDAFEE